MPLLRATSQVTAPPDPRRIEQAIARLQALPAFYPAVQKALKLLEDPFSTPTHLQQVICADQAVAARILQLANSAHFTTYTAVHTVSLAITLLGRERIQTLLHRFLAEELILMLSGRKPAARQIREISLNTAAAARSLADRLVRSDVEEALLAGLLHNIGELVLLSQFRDDYEAMLRLAEREPFPVAEVTIFGVESRMVGKWLLESWRFPAFFPAVIEHYADPWAVHFPAAPLPLIVIIHTARFLADSLLAGVGAEQVAAEVSIRVLSTLEADRNFLRDVYEGLPGELARLKSALA